MDDLAPSKTPSEPKPGAAKPAVLRCVTLVLVLALLLTTGCVRRRMTIRSQPAGATVYVDDQWIGVTPISTNYIYYGTRKIQLFKDGFETLTVKQPFSVPWYQYPPIDFVVENLWPWEIRDERVIDFQLQPQQIVPNQVLLDRASELRRNANQGVTTPLPDTPFLFEPEGSGGVNTLPAPSL